jgi:methylase of polypeptide subunit release factors
VEESDPISRGGGAGVLIISPKEVTGADMVAKMAKKKRMTEIKKQQEEALNEQMLRHINKKAKYDHRVSLSS